MNDLSLVIQRIDSIGTSVFQVCTKLRHIKHCKCTQSPQQASPMSSLWLYQCIKINPNFIIMLSDWVIYKFFSISGVYSGLFSIKSRIIWRKNESYVISYDTFKYFVSNAMCSKTKQLRIFLKSQGIRPDILEIHLL